MRRSEDLTGMQFGELTVLRRAPNDKYSRICRVCRCSSGNECTVQSSALKSGHTKSCGCLNDEKRSRMHEHMRYRDDTRIERLRRIEYESKPGKDADEPFYYTVTRVNGEFLVSTNGV